MERIPFREDALTYTGLLPDRSGINAFVVVIRELHDPERQPHELKDKFGKGWNRWRRKLKETPIEDLAETIMAHLEDGVPRTLNRIGVEMINKTADITVGTKFEGALWLLVKQGRVEYTRHAPILFRRRSRVAYDARQDLGEQDVVR